MASVEERVEALEADVISTKGDLRTYIAQIEQQKVEFRDEVALALAKNQNDFFPEALDSQFEKLSVTSCKPGLSEYLRLQVYRCVSLWLNLPTSFGLPSSEAGLTQNLRNKLQQLLNRGGMESLFDLYIVVKDNFAAIFS